MAAMKTAVLVTTLLVACSTVFARVQTVPLPTRLEQYQTEAAAHVDAMHDATRQMVDTVFSFGELGFQEVETARYLTDILRANGFTIQMGVAGIPTAWTATWGSGRPVIALGSDVDGVPDASQKPGVAYRAPIVDGAPGHGEGHNSGVPLNITAAIALQTIMERDGIPGTLRLWPGVAEELLGAKAYFVRAGVFAEADIVLFAHVGENFSVTWGDTDQSGLVSVEYSFSGESAHAARAPWRGRSALDAVELMNAGWNLRREHLRPQQRSHYVITNGGAQPNVVPAAAAVWYYFRETDYDQVKALWRLGDRMAEAATLMTDTTVSARVLGAAWPAHMNRTIAEVMHRNIERVGLPRWGVEDETLAVALQRELGVPQIGLAKRIPPLLGRQVIPDDQKRGGSSDDIGDVSWNVPTATLTYPANISAGPGHSWANAVAMATPIAHKGVTAGAKVQAMTALEFLLRAELVADAWNYFSRVQTAGRRYTPLVRADDAPATWLNADVMTKYRAEMRKYYYDSARYATYLDQLGIRYPTVR